MNRHVNANRSTLLYQLSYATLGVTTGLEPATNGLTADNRFTSAYSFVGPEGFEPTTCRLRVGSSDQTELRATASSVEVTIPADRDVSATLSLTNGRYYVCRHQDSNSGLPGFNRMLFQLSYDGLTQFSTAG